MPHPKTKTGDLTKSSVKFPSTGTKKLKTPLCPHLERGACIEDMIFLIKINSGSANSHRQAPRVGQDVDVKSPVGIWGPPGVGVGLDINRYIIGY